MIVEFFKRGTGGSNGPINYFLGKDRDREHAKLLSGDLEEVAELIDSSAYVKKYTAGCLSFFEDDLSDAKKKILIAAFENTLFPSLTPDQYRIVWIEHRDKEYIEKNEETGEEKKQRRLELNFLIPNVEITTGKRLQPFFAKADLNRVDDFKNIINYKYQLFDPDDPINRRATKFAKNLPKNSKEFKEKVHEEITLAICEDLITDRKSLLEWCDAVGFEVTKITKKQISINNPETGRPAVFKGEFYEQNFRNSSKSTELKREASEKYRQEANSRYRDCVERYKKLCESKSEYHLKRYGKRDRADSAEFRRHLNEQENKHTSKYKYNGGEFEQGYASDARHPTVANTENEKGLADIKRIEPSDSRTSEAEKSPFFIKYSVGFDSTYFAYFEHVSRLRQQNQIQRHQRNAEKSRISEIKRGELEYQQLRQPVVHPNRHEQNDLSRRIQNSERGQLNDVRSTIIEDYRRAAESIEATTARARESTATHSTAISDYRAVKTIYENFERQAQRSSEDRAEISTNSARTVRANYLSNFFTDCTRQLTSTITNTFKHFSERLEDREPSTQLDRKRVADLGTERNREANRAISTTNEREIGLSEQLSRKTSPFSTDPIFKALDQIDRRMELQRAQERKNDQGYDSPSPY